jgi:hypothetical protein
METRTIYLRDDWKGVTPAEVSVFVHEWCTTFRFQGITDMAGAVAGLVPVANDAPGLQARFQWLCEFTRAGNEELSQRAEGAILQRDDRRRIGNCWNICWQQLQGQMLPEAQHRERQQRKEAARRQQVVV